MSLPPVVIFGTEYDYTVVCGHCRHRLAAHVETPKGTALQCAYCHCIRHLGEDPLQPHNFGDSPTDPNPGIDETARDNDAEALADLGDVGDLDQYDRSTQ